LLGIHAPLATCYASHTKILTGSGRLTIGHEYVEKNIWITFPNDGAWYLFPHDEVQTYFIGRGRKGSFSSGGIPNRDRAYFEQFKL
jgi:hypothetical protein